MIYKPKNCALYEVLPEAFYKIYKHRGRSLWQVMDIRVLITLERLGKRYGKVYMNDYYWGGLNQEKGYRVFGTKTGASLSQHKFARAGDPKFSDATAKEVRADLKKHPDDETFEFITSIEMYVPWFHFDVRNWNKAKSGVLKVYPGNKKR